MGPRQTAYAMGTDAGTVTVHISRPWRSPELSPVLLALSVSVGATAHLLYVAGWSNYAWNGQLIDSPTGYLTYVI